VFTSLLFSQFVATSAGGDEIVQELLFVRVHRYELTAEMACVGLRDGAVGVHGPLSARKEYAEGNLVTDGYRGPAAQRHAGSAHFRSEHGKPGVAKLEFYVEVNENAATVVLGGVTVDNTQLWLCLRSGSTGHHGAYTFG